MMHSGWVIHYFFVVCFNSNRINYFDMLVSFRRRLVHPSLCASCLYKSMLYTVPCDIGAIILFSFLYNIFLSPLVGRRSSLFRSNSPFRFPLITYGSYIDPFELLLSSAFISRWKYQFSSDHWSQATSSVVSTWMGDRLGTPCNADIFIFFAFIICHLLTFCNVPPHTLGQQNSPPARPARPARPGEWTRIWSSLQFDHHTLFVHCRYRRSTNLRATRRRHGLGTTKWCIIPHQHQHQHQWGESSE